ncbi:DUF6789 family protein [Kitasatospora sp. NPDC097643]|uniref:DUF6789 family protein n=1 Tax=Kitasatospora sp. NPDC097643 TaxID=3157230 RepID=UPI00332B16E4
MRPGLARPAVAAQRPARVRQRPRALRTTVLQAALGYCLFGIGALPVLAIPLSLFGVIGLHTAADVLVFPLWGLALPLLCLRTPVSRAAAAGLIGGLIAVTAYDMLRLPFILYGGWPDFIPRLGGWITGSGHRNALVGYLWRYIGDGGGIGMAFALFCLTLGLRRRLTLLGLGYGVFVWSGLIGTLLFAPHGQPLLFHLTPATLAVSLAGHLVYGSVLGWTLERLDRKYGVLDGPPIRLRPRLRPRLRRPDGPERHPRQRTGAG